MGYNLSSGGDPYGERLLQNTVKPEESRVKKTKKSNDITDPLDPAVPRVNHPGNFSDMVAQIHFPLCFSDFELGFYHVQLIKFWE